jgi:hypothetical protein
MFAFGNEANSGEKNLLERERKSLITFEGKVFIRKILTENRGPRTH